MQRFSSEFPHDNPQLFSGASWLCKTVCSPARAVLRATLAEVVVPAPLPSLVEPEKPELEPAEGPSLELVEEACLEATERPLAAEADCGMSESEDTACFERFVRTIAGIVMETGATRAAAGLTQLLEQDRFDEATVGPAARAALLTGGYIVEQTGRLVVVESFLRTLRSWRAVLREQSVDLTECGASMLDQWAAELLVAWLGQPMSAAAAVRRRLRAAGIAAFGMLEQAA